MRYFLLMIFLFCNINLVIPADTPKHQESQDMKNLIIHGEGFAFTISEPEGWTVHIDDAAKKRLNAYFVVDGYSYDNTPGLIYIRVLKKQELTVEEHLKADMERFSQDDKGVVFEEFRPAGISYSFASKKYLFGDRYCDYLCYVDPGEKYNSYIIFVLSADMGNCSEYNDIYGQFLKSFFWITDEVFDRTNKNKGP